MAVERAITFFASLMAGPLATGLAIIAVAGIGLAMLTGRLQARAAGRVVVGCFVLFGSAAIADSLVSVLSKDRRVPSTIAQPPVTMEPLPSGGELPASQRHRGGNPFNPYGRGS